MRRLAIPGTLLGALLLAPSAVLAVPIPISGSNGENLLGSFTGSFDYTPIDATHGTIDIVLDNTSATLGYITAFVFNLPDGTTVSAAPLTASDGDFDDIGGPGFNNNVNGAPYGQFDIGAVAGRRLSKEAAVPRARDRIRGLRDHLLVRPDRYRSRSPHGSGLPEHALRSPRRRVGA